ncbi:MAG: hypothetical protein IPK21_03025 [Haliscomenobacter sp.]|nr:hypothetical protein [Haliscomenobacter sp.]
MKYLTALGFFLFLQAAPLLAQSLQLTDFNQQRLDRTRYSMYVLGAWGIANIAGGAVGMSQTTGSQRSFHQMNLGWGVVNLGLAASSLLTAAHMDPAAFDLYETARQHHRMQKILLFNAGLDVAYMAGGAWMLERAKTGVQNQDRLRGFGRSILLQGAFLFAFDLGAAIYLGGLESQLPPYFEHTSIRFDGQSLGFTLRF